MEHAVNTQIRSIVLTALFLSMSVAGLCYGEDTVAEGCSKCDKGKVTCKDHKIPISSKIKCSACIEAPCGCCGVGWLPCKAEKCPYREKTEVEFKEVAERNKAWVAASRGELESVVFADAPKMKDVRAIHTENDRFHFAGVLKSAKVSLKDEKGKIKLVLLEPHAIAHLYIYRLNEIFSVFCNLMGEKTGFKATMRANWRLVVWENEEQQKTASYKLCGLSLSNHTMLLPDFFSTFLEHNDDQLYAQIAHQTAVLLNNDYKRYVCDGIPVWLDEAVAHWIEYTMFGVLRIFNEGEVSFSPNCPLKDLEKIVRREVADKGKRLVPLAEFVNKDLDTLTGWNRIKGWSVVDWLRRGHSEDALAKLNETYKAQDPNNRNHANAFRDALNLTFDDVEQKWSQWVLANYDK